MKTKLTLSIEKRVIEKAKEYAREHGTTLSAIAQDFLEQLIEEKKLSNFVAEAEMTYEKKLSPEVVEKMKSFKKLVGIFKRIPNEKSYDELKWDYFKHKYGLED